MQVLISHNSPLQLLNMSPITVFALGITLLVVSIHILSQAEQSVHFLMGPHSQIHTGENEGNVKVHEFGGMSFARTS